jgi:hypothetical protein
VWEDDAGDNRDAQRLRRQAGERTGKDDPKLTFRIGLGTCGKREKADFG